MDGNIQLNLNGKQCEDSSEKVTEFIYDPVTPLLHIYPHNTKKFTQEATWAHGTCNSRHREVTPTKEWW